MSPSQTMPLCAVEKPWMMVVFRPLPESSPVRPTHTLQRQTIVFSFYRSSEDKHFTQSATHSVLSKEEKRVHRFLLLSLCIYGIIVKLRVLSNFLVIDPFYQICPFCPSSATGWGRANPLYQITFHLFFFNISSTILLQFTPLQYFFLRPTGKLYCQNG